MDRGDGDVFIDWLVADLFGRALHDGCDRRIRGSVDLDPGGEICGNGVGKKTKKKSRRFTRINANQHLRLPA